MNQRPKPIIVILVLAFTFIIGSAAGFISSWLLDSRAIQAIEGDIAVVTDSNPATDDGELVNPPTDDPDNDYWNFIKLPLVSIDFDELLQRNADTVGWLQVNSTNINYPVVQTDNNDYYLKHAFDHSNNGAGWIFADYRNNMHDLGQHTIIYGHSRIDTTMFGTLKNVFDSTWYNNKDNRVIFLSTPYQNTMWQVFSTYKTVPELYYLMTTFADEISYADFLSTITDRSHYDFNVKVDPTDRILTLSTCANNPADERIVLHAKLIKQHNRQ